MCTDMTLLKKARITEDFINWKRGNQKQSIGRNAFLDHVKKSMLENRS